MMRVSHAVSSMYARVHALTRGSMACGGVGGWVKIDDFNAPGIREYHARVQTFFIWFIEAASFLDLDDDRWRLLYLYERKDTPEGQAQYRFAGALSLYEYYA